MNEYSDKLLELVHTNAIGKGQKDKDNNGGGRALFPKIIYFRVSNYTWEVWIRQILKKGMCKVLHSLPKEKDIFGDCRQYVKNL